MAATPPHPTAEPPAPTPESLARAEAEQLRSALAKALADPAERAGLRLFAEGFHEDDYLTVEVFGHGVAIWDGERQFRAAPEEIDMALRAALAAGFPEMAPTYGGKTGGPRREGETDGGGPVRTVCAVEIQLGDAGKRVEQIAGGEQHAPLLTLAAKLLSQWSAAGAAGTAATGLDDGLAGVAAGRLAPETLRLTLHEKPELGTDGSGFLLRLRGREVVSRDFATGAGYGPERTFELSREELRALAGRLATLAPGRLPVNLFASGYLDLTIEVLGHRVVIQARRFAGMTADSHGTVQRDFDRLLESLRTLNR